MLVFDRRMQPPLTSGQQQQLLRWVRDAMQNKLRGVTLHQRSRDHLDPVFSTQHGVFVTLHHQGALRGCMGKVDFEGTVFDNAIEAGLMVLEDPRFPPVEADELPHLEIEITVLEPPHPIASRAEYDVTRHGIILEQGIHSALFLPQVAVEQGWTAEETLSALCHKAGLSPDAWTEPSTRLQVFEATAFSE